MNTSHWINCEKELPQFGQYVLAETTEETIYRLCFRKKKSNDQSEKQWVWSIVGEDEFIFMDAVKRWCPVSLSN